MNKIVDHPIVREKLSKIRDKNTAPRELRQLVNEIVPFLLYESTKNLPLREYEIETPIAKTTGYRLKTDVVFVPVLRAGLGMINSAIQLFPTARIGYIGLYRDENTFKPIQYYVKFPPIGPNTLVIVLDPMLATGNSSICAIDLINKTKPWKIQYIGLIASRAGLEKLNAAHPHVEVYVSAVDECLNESNYIVPGLGDAGDRLFGTK